MGTQKDHSNLFFRLHLKDGSIWKVPFDPIIKKIANLLLDQKTPWQIRYQKKGWGSHKFTDLSEALEEARLCVTQEDSDDIIQVIEWADIKEHIVEERPALTKSQMWDEWRDNDPDFIILSEPSDG